MPPLVPAVVNPKVPEPVTGLPVAVKMLVAGTEKPTLVTTPELVTNVFNCVAVQLWSAAVCTQ